MMSDTCTITRHKNLLEITMENVKETAAKFVNSNFNLKSMITSGKHNFCYVCFAFVANFRNKEKGTASVSH